METKSIKRQTLHTVSAYIWIPDPRSKHIKDIVQWQLRWVVWEGCEAL